MEISTIINVSMVAIALLICTFSKYISKLGPVFVGFISSLSSKAKRNFIRRRWSRTRKIVREAKNHSAVQWHTIRTYTLLMMFFLSMLFYLNLIALGPLKGMGQLPGSIQALISAPIYIFEVLWLLQRDYSINLIRASQKNV